jgi:hypothetical protein
VALLAFVACGGKVIGDDLQDASSGVDSSTPSDAGTFDVRTHPNPDDGATTTADVSTKPVCNHNGSGGSGGPGTCEILDEETCNGVTYQIDCRCPEATCTCSGTSGGLVTFTGCPSCPSIATAYTLCGYPH